MIPNWFNRLPTPFDDPGDGAWGLMVEHVPTAGEQVKPAVRNLTCQSNRLPDRIYDAVVGPSHDEGGNSKPVVTPTQEGR